MGSKRSSLSLTVGENWLLVGARWILIAVETTLALLVGYLLLLTGAAAVARRRLSLRPVSPTHRFLIVVPAHNEERLLPQLLERLDALDYPSTHFQVHVVADNCTDDTAPLARAAGATVHERQNEEKRGKGYALSWVLQRLHEAEIDHDAVVILDADSLVAADFLRVLDAHLARGERVIQAYYTVSGPFTSWSVSLRYAALALLHYVRPLGRMLLGGSAGLKGNGMVFRADILQAHQWSAALTEDIEFHMDLILDGERVTFAPGAVVSAEMPAALGDAHSQNVRWERGRIEMARRYIPRLLREALAGSGERRRFLLLDAVMEHLIPPFSVLAGASLTALLAAVILPGDRRDPNTVASLTGSGDRLKRISVLLGLGTVLGQAVYLLGGLRLARAPRAIFKALLFAPILLIWKIALYTRVLFGLDQGAWVRTARNRGEHELG